MDYIKDFKKFKVLLENNNLNYTQGIYESLSPSSYTYAAIAKGAKLSSYDYSEAFDAKSEPNLKNAAVDNFGKTSIPGLRIRNININNASHIDSVLSHFITGAAKSSGNLDAVANDDSAEKMVNDLKIEVESAGEIKGIGATGGTAANYIESVGYINSWMIKDPGEDTKISTVVNIAGYINGFNLLNWANGDFTQINPSKILNDKNRVDITSTSGAYENEKRFLYLVSPKSFEQDAGSREDTTVTTQGAAAKEGAVASAFDPMKFESTPESTWVQEIGEKIKGYLGDNGVIGQITLTSSASPDWRGKTTGVSNGTGDPSGGKLNDTTFSNEPSELGNQYLAYLRGLSFKNALIQYLGDAYPQTSNNTVINWKVSKDEPGGGRHFKYKVETTSESPTTVSVTTFQKSKSGNKAIDAGYFIYKIKFDASSLGVDSKGILGFGKKTAYENLKAGDQITIKGKANPKKSVKVTVDEIKDNEIYVSTSTQKGILIPKDRYIKLVSRPEEEVDEI